MKLNSDKCHLLLSGHHYKEMFINIGNNKVWESKNVEFLRITKDKDLKFDNKVIKICSKANRKFREVSCLQKREEQFLSPLLNHNSNTVF